MENVPPSQHVQSGGTATLSDERPTRTGYAFVGWNTNPDGMGIGYLTGKKRQAVRCASCSVQNGLIPCAGVVSSAAGHHVMLT